MQQTDSPNNSRMQWNAGGWIGSLFGSTLWLLLLGFALLGKDIPAAATSLVGGTLLALWGWHIWRSRDKFSAYAGIQRFMAGCTLVYTIVILTVNLRGASGSAFENGYVSTYLPYWALGMAPMLMLGFYFLERRGSQVERES